MTILWCISGAALLTALVAWRHARRTASRLEQLTHMYWELKYQQAELRAQLQRAASQASSVETPASGDAPAGDVFIPLTSLKS